jgi:hypothetical protein
LRLGRISHSGDLGSIVRWIGRDAWRYAGINARFNF